MPEYSIRKGHRRSFDRFVDLACFDALIPEFHPGDASLPHQESRDVEVRPQSFLPHPFLFHERDFDYCVINSFFG